MEATIKSIKVFVSEMVETWDLKSCLDWGKKNKTGYDKTFILLILAINIFKLPLKVTYCMAVINRDIRFGDTNLFVYQAAVNIGVLIWILIGFSLSQPKVGNQEI